MAQVAPQLGRKVAAPAEVNEEADELSDEAIGELLDLLPELEKDTEEEGGSDSPDPSDEGLLSLDDSDEADGDLVPLDFGSDSEDLLTIADPERGEDVGDSDGLFEDEPPPFEEPAKLARDDDEDFDDFHGLPASMPPLAYVDERETWNEPDLLPAQATIGDEARPAPAQRPFHDLSPGLALEACSAIASAEGIAVAASTDLLWFGAGETSPVRLDAGSARIHAVVLVGSGFDFAVCSTTSGKLLRRGRLASASEELRRVRDVTDAAPGSREALDLCQPGAGFPHTLIARTPSGRLLRSDDDGISFRRVSERRVVALGARGTPVALSAEGTLLISDDGGGSFSELPLDAACQRLARAEFPLVACAGAAVALAHPDFGALVSADRGKTFTRVRGTRGVSALAAGADLGEDTIFLALYDDSRNRTLLVRVAASSGSAETIGTVERALAAEDDGSESDRVLALAWDPSSGRLWAAGGFGVKLFGR
jgi:hypothetical protein